MIAVGKQYKQIQYLGNGKYKELEDVELHGFDVNFKYVLDEDIVFGKDYPSGYPDLDIYHILSLMNMDEPFSDILSNLKLESSFPEEMMRNILLDQNLIDAVPLDIDEEGIPKLSPLELSKILKNMGITASGKKKKLLKLVMENKDKLNIASGEYEVTPEGENFLNEFSWIEIYEYCLDYFEFNDYYKFMDEHEGNPAELTIDYLDEHIKLADEQKDFLYLNDCFESKVKFYLYNEDLELALDEELKTFIRRLNPMHNYIDVYNEYHVFDYDNIDNIHELSTALDLDVEKLYYDNWDSLSFEKEFISKEEGFRILERLLNSENIIDISEEYKKYLNID